MNIFAVAILTLYTIISVLVAFYGVEYDGTRRRRYAGDKAFALLAFIGWATMSGLLYHQCRYGAIQYALDHFITPSDDAGTISCVYAAGGIVVAGMVYALLLWGVMTCVRAHREDYLNKIITCDHKACHTCRTHLRDSLFEEVAETLNATVKKEESTPIRFAWNRNGFGPLKIVRGEFVRPDGSKQVIAPRVLDGTKREEIKVETNSYLVLDLEVEKITEPKTDQPA